MKICNVARRVHPPIHRTLLQALLLLACGAGAGYAAAADPGGRPASGDALASGVRERPADAPAAPAIRLAAAEAPAGAARPPASVKAWEVSDTHGVKHSLAAHRGKWVVVNFWATWCPPCLAEMPDFQAEWVARRDRDLVVLGVAMDWDSPDEVKQFAASRGVGYPVVLGTDALGDQFGVAEGLPVTAIYNPAGKLVKTVQGRLQRSELQRLTGH